MLRRVRRTLALLAFFLFSSALLLVWTFYRSAGSSAPSRVAAQASLEATTEEAQIELDQYGGFKSIASPKGKSRHWRVEKFGKRWMLVTPEGHAFWMMGVQSVQPVGDIRAKYRNLATWGAQQLRRLDAWGFNTLADYASAQTRGWNEQRDLRHMPSIDLAKFSQNVITNRTTLNGQVPAPDAVKDLIDCQDLVNGYTGWRAGLPDVYDPNFRIFVDNFMSALVADIYGEGIEVSSPWSIGYTADDTDYLFGFGPGLDLPVPDGSIHPHIGWLSLAAMPAKPKKSGHGVPYKDPTVFSKKELIKFLRARYKDDIAALNKAWGSNYSSFDSDGGWGSGRGLADENGQHKGWLGIRDGTLEGASRGVKADLDDFLYQWASVYFKVTSGSIRKHVPGMLVFSPLFFNNHGGITRKPILKAAAENCDILNAMVWNQQVLDLMAEAVGDVPIIPWEGQVANPDSSLHEHPNPYLSGIGKWNTQAERGAGYAARMDFLSTTTVTATGNQPIAGFKLWSMIDHSGEKINWGLVSLRDNAYDGKEAVIAIGVDPWGFKTGGEARNYGDFISSVKAANVKALQTICQQLGGCK